MYQNEYEIRKKYGDLGYKYLGSVNISPKAYEACCKSKQRETHTIGNCLQLVVLHDLKAMVEIDSGD